MELASSRQHGPSWPQCSLPVTSAYAQEAPQIHNFHSAQETPCGAAIGSLVARGVESQTGVERSADGASAAIRRCRPGGLANSRLVAFFRVSVFGEVTERLPD